jgi:hypothetical protein
MGFGSKMDDPVKTFLSEEPFQELTVANITMNKRVTTVKVRRKVIKVSRVPSIGEGIQVYDPPILIETEGMANEIGTYKTCTSCN